MWTLPQRAGGVPQSTRHPAAALSEAGRVLSLTGVVLPLLMIGALKFTQIEIDALKPIISGTPWLTWLYPVFGEAGAAYLLGTVEITIAALFVASPWSARAGVVAGALGALTFATTCSTMLALPIWEVASGGFPWLNATGSFLIKDVALLGVSLVVLGESIARFPLSRSISREDPSVIRGGDSRSQGPAPHGAKST